VTGPLLTVEIEGEVFMVMVDTGSMVSLIKPDTRKAQLRACDVQATGVSGTQLHILGVQDIKFKIGAERNSVTFVHPFAASPLEICSAGIFSMDFSHKVGAEINLTSHSLTMTDRLFRLSNSGKGAPVLPSLANDGQEGASTRRVDGANGDSVEEWVGTVELAEAVALTPLSGRIARCRVVRRDGSMDNMTPQNKVIMVDPGPKCLPRIYLARIVATMCNHNNSEL
jgi:hypothetical protein